MNTDDIKIAIASGSINAITLDTNAFGDPSTATLEHGTIARIKQFVSTDVVFVMSDVVLKEVSSHLLQAANDSISRLNKTLKSIGNAWNVDKTKRQLATEALFGMESATNMVSRRLSSFTNDTHCTVINAQDHAEIKELMDRYFAPSAPFSDKESKKNEFPDALALISLNAWAKANHKKILTISNDGDWKNYCDLSSNLICISDLATGLRLFNANADVAATALSQELSSGKRNDWLGLMSDAVQSHIDTMSFIPEADSFYYYEDDFCEAILNEVILADTPELIPIESSENTLVVELNVTATLTCHCEFNFSMKDGIDKDYIPMGSASLTAEDDLDLRLLITFEGEIPVSVQISDIEIDGSTRHFIDFGTIEPDWMNDPSNFEE